MYLLSFEKHVRINKIHVLSICLNLLIELNIKCPVTENLAKDEIELTFTF